MPLAVASWAPNLCAVAAVQSVRCGAETSHRYTFRYTRAAAAPSPTRGIMNTPSSPKRALPNDERRNGPGSRRLVLAGSSLVDGRCRARAADNRATVDTSAAIFARIDTTTGDVFKTW